MDNELATQTDLIETPTETSGTTMALEADHSSQASLYLASTAIARIREALTTELQVIPAAFRGLVVNLISNRIAPVLNLTDEQLAELDADADMLIDGIAERNTAIVGGLIRKYNITSGGIVGRVIARLMGAR